jgi:hypothetical protein
VENVTWPSPPAVFLLPEEQHFLLGDLMRRDGAGFVKLGGGDVTLVGAGSGATLDAELLGRVFYITAGNLTLTNLRIINGMATARMPTCLHRDCTSEPHNVPSSPIHCRPILAKIWPPI